MDIGANTFQFFTRNPRGAKSKAPDESDIERTRQLLAEHRFGPPVGHAPYIVNLAAAEERTRELAIRILQEDLAKIERIGCPYLVVHPGSHVGAGVEVGIERITDSLDQVLAGPGTAKVLLETMAGMGSEVGSTFEELEAIIAGSAVPERIGVCLDTCHIHAAGYAVRDGFGATLDRFDQVIGLSRLHAMHLNDSRFPAGAKKDRHADWGEGSIGRKGIAAVLGDRRLAGLPMILETPGGLETWRTDLEYLRLLVEGN